MAAPWYYSFLDPTEVKGLLFLSFILYLFGLAYAKCILPHLQGWIDIDEKTRQRIIQQRKERELKEKQAQEEVKRRLMQKNEDIIEEQEGEDEDEGTEKEEEIQTKKKKANKKKKQANKEKEKAKAA